jgi:hypothetical protein
MPDNDGHARSPDVTSDSLTLLSSVNNGDGTVTLTWFSPTGTAFHLYFRLKATLVP